MMKRIIVAAAALAALTAQSCLASGAPTPDQRQIVYGRDVPVVACSSDVVCDIVFADDDDILDIVAGDSQQRNADGWTIARGLEDTRPALYVTPNKHIGLTNLVVTTSQRTYRITLVAVSTPPRITSYVFLIPDEQGVVTLQTAPRPRVVMATPAPPQAAEQPVGAPPQYRGDGSLMPTSATRYADRIELTYMIPFGKHAPSFAQLLTDGTLGGLQVLTRVREGAAGTTITYTVYDLSAPIVVYMGEGRARKMLEVHI